MSKPPKTTGCQIKVQKVERPTNRSYYLNLPVVLAEALEITKGEEMVLAGRGQKHPAVVSNPRETPAPIAGQALA